MRKNLLITKLETSLSNFFGISLKADFVSNNKNINRYSDIEYTIDNKAPVINFINNYISPSFENISKDIFNIANPSLIDTDISTFEDFIIALDYKIVSQFVFKKQDLKYITFLKELERVSTLTYENSPIKISLIYNYEVSENFTAFSKKVSLNRLLHEAKPLLKLINGKSNILVLDKNLNVSGFIQYDNRHFSQNLHDILDDKPYTIITIENRYVTINTDKSYFISNRSGSWKVNYIEAIQNLYKLVYYPSFYLHLAYFLVNPVDTKEKLNDTILTSDFLTNIGNKYHSERDSLISVDLKNVEDVKDIKENDRKIIEAALEKKINSSYYFKKFNIEITNKYSKDILDYIQSLLFLHRDLYYLKEFSELLLVNDLSTSQDQDLNLRTKEYIEELINIFYDKKANFNDLFFSQKPINYESLIALENYRNEKLDSITNSLISLCQKLSKNNTSSIIIITPPHEENNAVTLVPPKNSFIEDFKSATVINKSITKMSDILLENICSIDGALHLEMIKDDLIIKDFGVTIGDSQSTQNSFKEHTTFGTGTSAAERASRNGIAIKISEDGEILVYHSEEKILHFK